MHRTIVLGLDIGGTKIAAAAITAQGDVLARGTMATEAERGFEDGVLRISALIEQVLALASGPRDPLCAIGIGCTGPLDPMRGTINNPYTLPTWDDVNIVQALQERFGVPVVLENDADAAAMGEVWLGAGRGGNPVIMVTVGTGIGAGIIVDGRIYRGVDGAHPEIGHHALDPNGPPCYCGVRGCWEVLASGPAMAAAARERMPDRPPESFTGATVVAMARAGHPVAQEIVQRAVQATALGIFNVVNFYLPEIVVLGGGVMEAYDLFAPAIHQVLQRDTMAPVARISVRPAALGNEAGMLGAARLALDRLGAA